MEDTERLVCPRATQGTSLVTRTNMQTDTETPLFHSQILAHESGTIIPNPSVTKEAGLGFWQVDQIKVTYLDD